jgi:hypothetical protein
MNAHQHFIGGTWTGSEATGLTTGRVASLPVQVPPMKCWWAFMLSNLPWRPAAGRAAAAAAAAERSRAGHIAILSRPPVDGIGNAPPRERSAAAAAAAALRHRPGRLAGIAAGGRIACDGVRPSMVLEMPLPAR